MLTQNHDDTDNISGFDVQYLLPSDYNGPNIPSQQHQPDWSTFSRPFTSQPTASGRIAPSTSLHNGSDFSTAEVPASRPLPENSANNSLNGLSSPQPQSAITGVHHNSTHTGNSLSGSSIHRGENRRPQSHRQPTWSNFVEHGASLRPVSRGNEMCESSHERCQLPPRTQYRHPSSSQSANPYTERPTSSGHANSPTSPLDRTQKYSSSQNPYWSTRDFGPASPLITDPVSPLQDANTHCLHCSCNARPASGLASPELTPPRNSAPDPARPTNHTPSSRNLEILSECSQALRNLVHNPNTNSLVDKRQSCSGESSRKSEEGNFAVYSPIRDSVDKGYDGEMEPCKRVEKVVIVYVNRNWGESGWSRRRKEISQYEGRYVVSHKRGVQSSIVRPGAWFNMGSDLYEATWLICNVIDLHLALELLYLSLRISVRAVSFIVTKSSPVLFNTPRKSLHHPDNHHLHSTHFLFRDSSHLRYLHVKTSIQPVGTILAKLSDKATSHPLMLQYPQMVRRSFSRYSLWMWESINLTCMVILTHVCVRAINVTLGVPREGGVAICSGARLNRRVEGERGRLSMESPFCDYKTAFSLFCNYNPAPPAEMHAFLVIACSPFPHIVVSASILEPPDRTFSQYLYCLHPCEMSSGRAMTIKMTTRVRTVGLNTRGWNRDMALHMQSA